MDERKVIIFTALEIERRAVVRALQGAQSTWGTPVPQEFDQPFAVETIAVGIRAVRGSVWQNALNSAQGSRNAHMIVAGLGGGLDPTLRVGDVVIDGGDDMLGRELGPPCHFGPIHTADDLICTVEAKSQLFQATGAMAVDMETALIRKAALERGLPVIGVRAISDSAHAAIDPTLLSFVDEMGRPLAGRIALALMARPTRALALRRMGRDTRLALGQLEIAMRQIVDRLNGGVTLRHKDGPPLQRPTGDRQM